MKTILFVLLAASWVLGCDQGRPYQVRPADAPLPLSNYEARHRQDPADADAMFDLGAAYLGLDRNRAAVEIWTKLVEAVPGDAAVHYYLGVALAREQKKGAAIASFEQAVALEAGFAEAHWALALLYNERGDGYAQALQACRRGLELQPQSAYGHFVHGFVQCSRGGGDNQEAAIALRQAVQIDPDLAHAHYYLALVYLRLQDDQKAIEAVENTVRADPEYTAAYYTLGTLYARTGREEEGERMIGLFQRLSAEVMKEDHYTRLLYRQSEPLNSAEEAASRFNLGLVHLRQQRFDEALDQFEASLALKVDNAEAWLNIGTVHSLRGDFAEAAGHYRRALEIEPEYALAWTNLGTALLAAADYSGAEGAFRRAVELDADAVQARQGLSTALIQMGRVAEGKKWRQQEKAGTEGERE
jgi:tetratricopeptide (TPR) repeat protein